jgi:hypothetical protein
MKTYITRAEALRNLDVSEAELDSLIEAGRVDVVELMVSDDETVTIYYYDDIAAYVAERDISPENFDHLRGNLLSFAEAAREYKTNHATISRWVKNGLLEVKGTGKRNRKFVDEADVAYLITLGRAKGMRPGKKPFSNL